MLGISIFLHSFRQVSGNFGMAIRLSWWAIAIAAALGYVIFQMMFSDPANPQVSGFALLLWAGLMLFLTWSFSLIGVVWHRFILMEEIPTTIIPYKRGLNVWPYFWFGVAIFMIMIVAGFIASILLGILIRADTTLKILFVGILVGLLITTLFYRLALILPAVALGKKLTFGQAFELTRGFLGPIIGLVVATVIFRYLADFLIDMMFGLPLGTQIIEVKETGISISQTIPFLPLYLLVTFAVQWFIFMVNFSILTTLYGYIVEKREIS